MCKKAKIEDIKNSFEEENYIILLDYYSNNKQKFESICPNGHTHKTSWNSWQSGYRCYACSVIRSAEKRRTDYTTIKKYFNSKDYLLITNTYKNTFQILDTLCPKGHIYKVNFHNFKYGARCKVCSIINRLGANNPNWRGGISANDYCPIWKDKEYKKSIKYRDNCKCQNPYCYSGSIRLAIHHIDYDKTNCKPNNLITLCTGCNTRANKDRLWHTYWYKTILSKRSIS